MLRKLQTNKEEGFTIIEVLIVLAIAGLIMLIVFLAIPALRRNQQNTTMRSEASRILALATEYESNSNGQQVNSAARATEIFNGAGTLTQITSIAYGAGATTTGQSRIVIGTCNGTTAAAAAGRTYALQFGLHGGQTACIQS